MRFQPNQVIWTLFAYLPRNSGLYQKFYDFDTVAPENYPALEFRKLVVTEHHKVYSEYDSREKAPECDGFILKDEKGNIWHNQYPTASYGQISDTADRRFNQSEANAEYKTVLEWLDTRDRESRCPHPYEMAMLTNELQDIRRNMHTLETGKAQPFMGGDRDPDLDRLEKLKMWHDHIIDQFEKQSGLKIESAQHYLGSKDGEQRPMEGWFDYTVTQQEPAHV